MSVFTEKTDKEFLDYAVTCARDYAKSFRVDCFAIFHLSKALGVGYEVAKHYFYNHEVASC